MSTRKSTIAIIFCCVGLLAVTSTMAMAQDKQDDKKKEIPEPETVQLTTKDNVVLNCTYFAGTNGKESIPVLILHDWEGSRDNWLDLAAYLQKEHGHAVLVPDLRGHGASTTVEGSTEKLDPSKWQKAEIASMIRDIEQCKRFLREKNDEGELNVDMMSLIAEGKTCILAIEWAIADWSYGPISGVEQGQDVKSIVLLSPEKTFRGLSLTRTIKNPLYTGPAEYSLSMLIMGNADKSKKSLRDTKSIYTSIDRMRKESKDGDKFIYHIDYKTKLQKKVVEQVGKPDAKLGQVIGFFIDKEAKRFADENRWQSRKLD